MNKSRRNLKGNVLQSPTSDVSQVFGQNLRELVTRAPSISHVCRELDINRSQFNRYLSGEANPRPDILQRICAYFDCDARILLSPLAVVEAQDRAAWPYGDDSDPFDALTRDFDHTRMPDGLYRFLLPNMVNPGTLVVDMIRLFTSEHGVKGVHWSVPKLYAESIGLEPGWRHRKMTGYAYQHIDGVSLLMANPHSRLLMMCFVTQGYRGVPTIYTGYSAMTLSKGPMQTQVQPLLITRMPPNCATVLKWRREQPNLGMEDLTPAEREYLENWRAP